MNQLFVFSLVIGTMLVGTDVMLRGTPAVQRQYRRVLRGTWNFIKRNVTRFVRWAWRNYRQGIIGFAIGLLVALYFTGHFQ